MDYLLHYWDFGPVRHSQPGTPLLPADGTLRPTRRCSALIPLHRRLPHPSPIVSHSPRPFLARVPPPARATGTASAFRCARHAHGTRTAAHRSRSPDPIRHSASVPRLPTRPDPAVALTRRVCLRTCGAALSLAGHDDVLDSGPKHNAIMPPNGAHRMQRLYNKIARVSALEPLQLQCSPSYMRWAPPSYVSLAPGDPPYGPLPPVRACKSTSARVHSPYPLARLCDETWPSYCPHLQAAQACRSSHETVRPRTPYSFLFPYSSFSQILLALTHPHPRHSPGSTSPSPSALWPMTGRSSATADPLIEGLPGASPTLDPRPTAAPLCIQLTLRHRSLPVYTTYVDRYCPRTFPGTPSIRHPLDLRDRSVYVPRISADLTASPTLLCNTPHAMPAPRTSLDTARTPAGLPAHLTRDGAILLPIVPIGRQTAHGTRTPATRRRSCASATLSSFISLAFTAPSSGATTMLAHKPIVM
ncbi:hypothetical protein B0H14DRAFT_3491835 [Mycena olivaceomarginata]|nr:hypothetical protein B0H14DRAFT_3491835 [Mycena olivaceomarginata]